MEDHNGVLLKNPSWPSLYNPRSEIFHIQHHEPIQPNGFYLVNSEDVFRFTLYWTLVFYIPVFVVFGLYAFFNLSFPPKRRGQKSDYHVEDDEIEIEQSGDIRGAVAMTSFKPTRATPNGYETLRSDVTSPHLRSPTSASSVSHLFLTPHSPSEHTYPPFSPQEPHMNITRIPGTKKTRKPKNEGRSRVTFALLVLFSFLLLSLIGAVISSAIIGYILTGLYKAGKFYMSTWVPFLWAAITVMVGMLNVWPSVINLI